MSRFIKGAKSCPTDLTWEEQNPSSYLFNKEVLNKLKKTIENVKKENSRVAKGIKK